MRWTRKNECYSRSYRLKGRKNGYKAEVVYSEIYQYYYFYVTKGEKRYNSLWDRKPYATEKECKEACEEYCATH